MEVVLVGITVILVGVLVVTDTVVLIEVGITLVLLRIWPNLDRLVVFNTLR